MHGFESAETTIALSQLIELGGKRSKRRQVAELEKGLAEWDYQSARLQVLSAATKAFIEVLSAQRHLQQSEELVALSEKTLEAVASRVEAGKVPPVEQTRAKVELAATRTRLDNARRQLQSARSRLSSFWGAKRSSYGKAAGNLAALPPLPSEEQLLKRLENNPDLARWVTVGERREAELDLARARAIPDLTVTLGARNMRDSDSNALVAGFEIPLPIFDRNQGGIGEARANISKARAQRLSARIELESGISQAWQTLAAAYTEALTLREEILPGAKSAFEVTKYGYREGKFDFLQMLDAQRTLFEVREQYLQSLAAYHLARTEVERLIGAPLHNVLETASNQNRDLR
jgi:cobalt-zinc-cadmium efflux system outer membrane protein